MSHAKPHSPGSDLYPKKRPSVFRGQIRPTVNNTGVTNRLAMKGGISRKLIGLILFDLLFTGLLVAEFVRSESSTDDLMIRGANVIANQSQHIESGEAPHALPEEARAVKRRMYSSNHDCVNRVAVIGLLVVEKYIFIVGLRRAIRRRETDGTASVPKNSQQGTPPNCP